DIELFPRLHTAQAIHHRLCVDQASRAEHAEQVHHRLTPEPRADRQSLDASQSLRDLVEHRSAVIGLADDKQLAGSTMGQIKLGEHARKDECRLFPGAEECTAHPAVRVRDVAEGWNVALETR